MGVILHTWWRTANAQRGRGRRQTTSGDVSLYDIDLTAAARCQRYHLSKRRTPHCNLPPRLPTAAAYVASVRARVRGFGPALPLLIVPTFLSICAFLSPHLFHADMSWRCSIRIHLPAWLAYSFPGSLWLTAPDRYGERTAFTASLPPSCRYGTLPLFFLLGSFAGITHRISVWVL